jgi:hypothetical protein
VHSHDDSSSNVSYDSKDSDDPDTDLVQLDVESMHPYVDAEPE